MKIALNNYELSSFYEASAWLGRSWLLCQATGGNTSFKTKEGLLIKASGARLASAEQAPERTFVNCEQPTTGLRPSMEVVFHKVIPWTYVFHYHPLRFLLCSVLGLSIDLQQRVEAHGMSCLRIPYAEPGQKLADQISCALETSCQPDVLLLENHGVVVGAENLSSMRKHILLLEQLAGHALQDCLPALVWIEKHWPISLSGGKAPEFLQLNPILASAIEGCKGSVPEMAFLFPDQAVYLAPVGSILNGVNVADQASISCLDRKTSQVLLRDNLSEVQREYALVTLYLMAGIGLCPGNTVWWISAQAGAALVSNPCEIYRSKAT
jgi:ribulose-5-phosphate 4-epimerase/fuculose-1-phosphate aldolase